MTYKYLAYAALALVVLSALAMPASAQSQQIGVIKLDVSRTTVYRGYQWVEVIAYIYTGIEDDYIPPVSLTKATATLDAGIRIELSMVRVTLTAPTVVVVDGVEYPVQELVIVRVHVPEAAYTGKGLLRIEITGRVPYFAVDFSFRKDVVLEIVDHRPILDAKTEVRAALERVRAVVTVASALGIDVTEYVEKLSTIESTIAEATERLDIYGEVDEALALYKEATSSLASLEASVISVLAIRYGAVESRLSSLEVSLERTVESVEALSKDLAKSVGDLRGEVEKVSEWAADAISTLAKQIEDYSKKVDESLTNLAYSVDNAMKSLAEGYEKTTRTALDELAGKVRTLDENVAELSKSQKELASRVSDISNTLQIGLVVVALMLLLAVALMKFLK